MTLGRSGNGVGHLPMKINKGKIFRYPCEAHTTLASRVSFSQKIPLMACVREATSFATTLTQ